MAATQFDGTMKSAADAPAIVSVGVLADDAFVFRERRSDVEDWDVAEELERNDVFMDCCVERYRRHIGFVEVKMQILCQTMTRRFLLLFVLKAC